ncbi:MAG: LamG-like jellyroll fold domain-containing protein, partial [Bacteroidota bacterium]
IWFKLQGVGDGQVINFNNGQVLHGGNWCKTLYIGSSGLTFFTYQGVETTHTYSANYLDNSWHNCVVTMDASGSKIYIDGVLKSYDANQNGGQIYSGYYRFGGLCPNDLNNSLIGFYDDIAIWNRALTQQEITSLYSGQAPCTKPEPVSLGTSMSTELCPNEAVTIKIVSPADSANYTYQWTRNGTNMVGATTRSITVNDAAKYKVFVRSGPGVDCQRVSGLVETTPSIPPAVTATAPNGTAYCPGDSVLMTATGATAGYSYRWKRFGVVIAGANSSTYYATQTGNYRCEIFNPGGCITQSNLISITNGTSCRIMGETNSDVSVYPNPAKNSFTVSFNDIGNEAPVSVSLRSMQGQVIENRKLASKEDVQFAVGKLSPGLYMVSILLDSGDSIEKTVVVE